jgi:hypothetical protein
MPTGMFRSDDGWAKVDYGTGTTIPIPRSRYEANGYKPDFEKLPSEATTVPQRTRRKMMPGGPKVEQRPKGRPKSWVTGDATAAAIHHRRRCQNVMVEVARERCCKRHAFNDGDRHRRSDSKPEE